MIKCEGRQRGKEYEKENSLLLLIQPTKLSNNHFFNKYVENYDFGSNSEANKNIELWFSQFSCKSLLLFDYDVIIIPAPLTFVDKIKITFMITPMSSTVGSNSSKQAYVYYNRIIV